MTSRLRPRHWLLIAILALVGLLLVWIAIAYGGLPRIWSHHEHKRVGARDEIISYTAQDIPADPINLHVKGDAAQIACAFTKAGWTRADDVSLQSSAKIVSSVVLHRADASAPVSPLYVHDRIQDVAYQLDSGGSADRRHHVRLWQVAPDDWLAAATYDRGVGLSLFTLQVTHHIGSDVDADRDAVGTLLNAAGGQFAGTEPSRIAPGKPHRNGGGDHYVTDGQIKVYKLGPGCDRRGS
jgi:hypothetical protein